MMFLNIILQLGIQKKIKIEIFHTKETTFLSNGKIETKIEYKGRLKHTIESYKNNFLHGTFSFLN